MSLTVKTERISPANSVTALAGSDGDEIQDKIIQLCGQFPKGVNNAVIQSENPNADTKQVTGAINQLLVSGKIDVFKQGDTLLYRLKDKSLAEGLKNTDNQEKVVYNIISAAGNKGIWSRDIRFKSNLLLPQVNKILKSLETKKLVKSVKCVGAAKKKVYMLFGLEPDRSLTGGSWYSDQDFDFEFVQVLHQQCLRFLKEKVALASKMHPNDPASMKSSSFVSSREMWNFIKETGISKAVLSVEDIEMILETLIYDGKVEKSVIACEATPSSRNDASSSGQMNIYRSVESLVPVSPIVHAPCAVCPVFDSCRPGGAISPETCVYMKDWLDY